MNRNTGFSPFGVVYSTQPHDPLDLIALPSKTKVHGKAVDFVNCLQVVHTAVHENPVISNFKYKQIADRKRRHLEFDVGDFVWAILIKDYFVVGDYNKLSAKKIGHVEIVEKINPNAYRLKLPSHLCTTDAFNVMHLIPNYGDSSDDDSIAD